MGKSRLLLMQYIAFTLVEEERMASGNLPSNSAPGTKEKEGFLWNNPALSVFIRLQECSPQR